MSGMREALVRAGLAVRPQAAGERLGERSAVSFADPASLDDAALVAALDESRIAAADILRQIQDDAEDGRFRGDDWRGRARRARRSHLQRIDQLEAAARARGIAAAFPELALKASQRAAREAEEEARKAEWAARKAEAQAEREAEWEARRLARREALAAERLAARSRAELFMTAAHDVLTAEERDRIWSKARERFPGHPAWGGEDAP